MNRFFDELQPAVKKETKRLAVIVAIGVVLMWLVFLVLHLARPEVVPFDYTVILGGLCGGFIAVLNFFLMALAVQRTVANPDEKSAKAQFRASYTQRMLLQMLWTILAIVVPCFQFAAGIIPLFIPNLGIKVTGLVKKV